MLSFNPQSPNKVIVTDECDAILSKPSFNPHCFNPPSLDQASTEINRIRNVFVEYCIGIIFDF